MLKDHTWWHFEAMCP